MKERPILMNGEMVRAILEGRKTQTRRIVKDDVVRLPLCKQPFLVECPYGIPGDRLWVKETSIIAPRYFNDGIGCNARDTEGALRMVQYLASDPNRDAANDYRLKVSPSIFMPRWASRITLEITDVRVQRLQDITEEEAQAEGVSPQIVTEQDIQDTINGTSEPHIKELARILGPGQFTAKFKYQELWDSINAKRGFGWDSNCWVWVLTFRRV